MHTSNIHTINNTCIKFLTIPLEGEIPHFPCPQLGCFEMLPHLPAFSYYIFHHHAYKIIMFDISISFIFFFVLFSSFFFLGGGVFLNPGRMRNPAPTCQLLSHSQIVLFRNGFIPFIWQPGIHELSQSHYIDLNVHSLSQITAIHHFIHLTNHY